MKIFSGVFFLIYSISIWGQSTNSFRLIENQDTSWEYHLDSTLIFEFNAEDSLLIEKEVFFYDTSFQQTGSEQYKWDSIANSIRKSLRKDVIYYSVDTPQVETYFFWEENSLKWEHSSQTTYEYNTEKLLISKKELNYDLISASWKKASKIEYEYDSLLRITKENNFEWVDSLDKWKEKTRICYFYNENNNNAEWIYYKWGENDWVITGKIEFQYNPTKKLIKTIYYEWSSLWEVWLEYYKEEYEYLDNDEYFDECTQYNWNIQLGDWEAGKKYEYERDLTGNIKDLQTFIWSETDANWLKDWHTYYSYNEDSTIVCYNEFWFDGTLQRWMPQQKTYDYYSVNYIEKPKNPHIPTSYEIKLTPTLADQSISIISEFPGTIHYEIISLSGRVLIYGSSTVPTFNIDITNIVTGFYICHTTAGINDKCIKFFKK